MSIEVTCLECGSSHHVNNRLAGRRVRCPNCETAVHVPELEVEVNADPSEDRHDVPEVEVIEVEPIAVEQPVLVPPIGSAQPASAGALCHHAGC